MKMLLTSMVLAASCAGVANAEVYKLPNGATATISKPSQAEVNRLAESLQYPLLVQKVSSIDWLSREDYEENQDLKDMIAADWPSMSKKSAKIEGANVIDGQLNLAVRVGAGDGLHDFYLQVQECETKNSCKLKLTHMSNNLAESSRIAFISYDLTQLGLSAFAKKSSQSVQDMGTKSTFLEYTLSIEGEKEFWQTEDTPNPVFDLSIQ